MCQGNFLCQIVKLCISSSFKKFKFTRHLVRCFPFQDMVSSLMQFWAICLALTDVLWTVPPPMKNQPIESHTELYHSVGELQLLAAQPKAGKSFCVLANFVCVQGSWRRHWNRPFLTQWYLQQTYLLVWIDSKRQARRCWSNQCSRGLCWRSSVV